MRRWICVLALAALAGGAFTAAASGQRPDREPFQMEEGAWAAGDVCDFALEAETVQSNWTLTTFRDGRQVVTGTGTTRLTNVDTGESILVRDSGRLTITDISEEETRFDFHGRFVLWFYEGDLPQRGLFLTTGRVSEVLHWGHDLITSFELQGQRRDLCAELAP
jgi:hypothetical protein